MKRYVLKNKDRDVLEFSTVEYTELIKGKEETSISLDEAKILNERLLPFNIEAKYLKSSLEKWIIKRKIPQNRAFVENILGKLSIEDNFMAYVDVSLALSLNDSFWIVPANKECKWKDYNLYKNKFNEALELAGFGHNLNTQNGFVSSPEFTTNGMLKKCWHREDSEIYLFKGASSMYESKNEPYSEYYMAQVAKVMNFEAIDYDLKLFHNELVSTCPIFTSEKEGYVPIYDYYLSQGFEKKNTKRGHINPIMKLYGKEAFEDLMVFDALIANRDRHLGNFGMIVDNDTLKVLRPAPIFDNGLSMITHLDKDKLENIDKELSLITSFFDYSFDEQLKIFAEQRHRPNLEKLSDFSFTRHPEFNLSEEWLQPIEACIRDRAKMALRFIDDSKHYSMSALAQTAEQNAQTRQSLAKETAIVADKNDSSAMESLRSESAELTKEKNIKNNENLNHIRKYR